MDKSEKTTMEQRFSLNMTNLPDPIAESTCVNLNATRAAAQQPPRFQWGGAHLSPKNRSNSLGCLSSSNNGSSVADSSESPSGATSPKRLGGRMNMSRIDPRIYADVQSTGLAARIVKYHENGATFNRSASTNNLSSRPGQFPIVHLQKVKLPQYKAVHQHLSMTRIAPPEKSMFVGCTLSSLLRSNSIVGVQKTDEEISRENRPILHPPPTERDLAPTRSVLDVLKEISRKRINSDELMLRDATKKYCNHEGNSDFIDGGYGQASTSNHSPASMHSYKRQREQQQNQHNQQSLAPGSSGSANNIGSSNCLQPQRSPEQIAKRRFLSNYNNDITSSLSSSLTSASAKRKLQQQRALTDELEAAYTRAKVLRSEQATYALNAGRDAPLTSTPITAIPAVPLNQTASAPPYATAPLLSAQTNAEHAARPARTTSYYPVKRTSAAAQPRITLFNKKYDEATEIVENGDADAGTTAGDCAGIHFVRPKKQSELGVIGTRNPVIERTQRSKLAMMLSGLRGELYQGDSEPDCGAEQASQRDNVDAGRKAYHEANRMPAAQVAPVSTPVVPMFGGKSPIQPTTIVSTPNRPSAPTLTAATPISTTVSTPIATPIAIAPPAVVVSSTTSPATASTPSAAPAPAALGTFQFTPPAAPNAVVKKTSPLVGLKLTPQSPGTPMFGSAGLATPSASVPAAAVPQLVGFSFGKPATTTITTPPSAGGLSFGATPPAPAPAAASTPAVAPTTTQASVPQLSFSFSPPKNPTPLTAAAAPASSGGFAFGKDTTVAAKPMTTPKLGGFAFGATPTPAPTAPANITPTPSTTAAATTTPISSSTGFTFGGTALNAPGAFSFGQLGGASTKAATPPTFGAVPTSTTADSTASTASTALTTTTTSTNSTEGAISAKPAATTFSFGSAAPTAAFSFGGAATLAAPPTVPPTTKPTVAATPFSFCAPAPAGPAPAIATPTTAFGATFTSGGAKSATETPNAFGLFAAAAPKPATTSNTPMFGNLSAPTAVSVNNSMSNNVSGQTAPSTSSAPMFSFGAVASKSAATPSLFGGAKATASTTTTSSANAVTFSFTGSAATASPNLFGGSKLAAPVATSAPAAGGFSFAAPSTSMPAGSTFGALAASGAAKPFSFGAPSNSNSLAAAPTTGPSATGLFGGASVKPSPIFGGGGMGDSVTMTNNTGASTPFSFAAAAAGSATTAAVPTLMTGAAATALGKPNFNFGSGGAIDAGGNGIASQPTASANIFGQIAAPAPSFGFGGGANAHNAGPTSNERPIRRATRRLQKF